MIINYTYVSGFFEVLAALVGALLLKKYKATYTRYFIYFLIYVVFVEIVAMYPRYVNTIDFLKPIQKTRFYSNYWWYVIFWEIGSACFFSFYFQKTLKTKRYKSILKYLRYVFIIASIVVIITDLDKLFIYQFSTIQYFNTVMILLCASFYFIEALRSERLLTFSKSMGFYVSVALFIWWLVTTPMNIYSKYYNADDMDFVNLNWAMMAFSNVFMYSVFAFGLIVSKPEKQ